MDQDSQQQKKKYGWPYYKQKYGGLLGVIAVIIVFAFIKALFR